MVEFMGMTFTPGLFVLLVLILGVLAGWMVAKMMRPVVIVHRQCVHTVPKADVDEFLQTETGKRLIKAIMEDRIGSEM